MSFSVHLLLFISFSSICLSYGKLANFGVPNYSCSDDVMKPSKKVPTNVNSVRPADIKVVMALGDSITAANGAGAEDPVAVILQYRGLAFQAGGDYTLTEHATIPNILKKYNPNLFGYSNGIGSPNVWEIARLNVAVPGAEAKDLPSQARSLVSLLKQHTQEVDLKNDWKLLNIFIGGNDACGYCRHPEYAPQNCADNIEEAIRIVFESVPRVIVSITGMLQLQILRQTDHGHFFCERLHKDECGCELNKTVTNDQLGTYGINYTNDEIKIQNSGKYDTNDFTVVVQPFFRDMTAPPSSQIFFAPDCFHFSQYGHGIVTTWLWKNILEPVNYKTTIGDMNNAALPLACPDPTCPFIRTVKNSGNCSPYMTAVADSKL
ncbi:unnamed protein product [Auanema sp. JU1783]|nr:unnamed protein product [Auanema sp. JU1783]